MLKQMRAAGKALTEVVTAGVKLAAGYARPLTQAVRKGSAVAVGFAGELNDGLKEEWHSYGKTGQRVLVAGSIAIAAGLGATFAFTEPVCPTHPIVGVGNPEFRCATHQPK